MMNTMMSGKMTIGMMKTTMNKLIKKILRESEFEWTTDLPAEDDVVYLNLTVGEPDWEYGDSGELLHEDPEWVYWNLYLYVPKQVYRDITGQHDLSGDWDEWNIGEREGEQLLDYFYEHNFDRKQKHGLSTAIHVDEQDGGFTVVDKNLFCSNVGAYHPDKCNLYNR